MTVDVRDKRPARKDDVWVRDVKQERAIFDPSSGALHFLNETALAIWQLCDGETLPEEMIGAICEISGLHRDLVAEDVARILTEFDRAELIEWRI